MQIANKQKDTSFEHISNMCVKQNISAKFTATYYKPALYK